MPTLTGGSGADGGGLEKKEVLIHIAYEEGKEKPIPERYFELEASLKKKYTKEQYSFKHFTMESLILAQDER